MSIDKKDIEKAIEADKALNVEASKKNLEKSNKEDAESQPLKEELEKANETDAKPKNVSDLELEEEKKRKRKEARERERLRKAKKEAMELAAALEEERIKNERLTEAVEQDGGPVRLKAIEASNAQGVSGERVGMQVSGARKGKMRQAGQPRINRNVARAFPDKGIGTINKTTFKGQ